MGCSAGGSRHKCDTILVWKCYCNVLASNHRSEMGTTERTLLGSVARQSLPTDSHRHQTPSYSSIPSSYTFDIRRYLYRLSRSAAMLTSKTSTKRVNDSGFHSSGRHTSSRRGWMTSWHRRSVVDQRVILFV